MLLDYLVTSKKFDFYVDKKSGFVDIMIRIGTQGSEVKVRLSDKEFKDLFDRFKKAHDQLMR